MYLLVEDAGKDDLYEVSASGGKPVLAVEPASGGYTALEIPQKSTKPLLIAAYGSSVSPQEIVRIDLKSRSHVNLTHVDTAAAAGIDWQPPEHFYFTSAKGRRIHNMLVRPPAFDASKKYPLLVLIHGGPASSNPDQIGLRWNYHLLAAPGYVVLMTDYTGSTSFGEKFAQAIKLDPLKTPGEEIDQAVDEALKRYSFIDGSRMCAAGASYGGHLCELDRGDEHPLQVHREPCGRGRSHHAVGRERFHLWTRARERRAALGRQSDLARAESDNLCRELEDADAA